MEKPLILVADAESKNLQILRDSLESSGFSVVVANDGVVAWEKIQSEHPDLILSELNLPNFDGFQLLEKLKEDPVTSVIPVMFLTSRRDIQDRVRSLRGGVKDYMIKPLHVKEVIARVRMILRRISRVKSENTDSDKKMAGRIEEYSVIELIDNFGANRKTGVLQLYNEQNRNGEIWFKAGAVIHASFGTLKSEKAVYQMLPWQQGHFVMTFKEVNVPETINVSNLGLLLHGYKRMEQREQLFGQLPSPETTFVLSDEFRKVVANKELSQEASKFLALIDGRRDIMQIIDESVYDDIQSLERLAKLYKQKFIVPGKPVDQTSTEINISAIKSELITDDLRDAPEAVDVLEHPAEEIAEPGLEHEHQHAEPANDESGEPSTQSQDQIDMQHFPPPDFDALDADDEEEPSRQPFRRNGVRDKLFYSRKNAEIEPPARDEPADEPQTEELRQSPEKSFLDHFDFKSTLKKADNKQSGHQEKDKQAEAREGNDQFRPLHSQTPKAQVSHSPENESQARHELLTGTTDDQTDHGDNETDFFAVPEPMHYQEFAPGLDISNPFSNFQPEKAELDVQIKQDEPGVNDRDKASPQAQDDSYLMPSESELAPEDYAESEQEELPAQVEKPEESLDTKKQTYSFPLRSYGRPRFDKKHEFEDEKSASVHQPEPAKMRVEQKFDKRPEHAQPDTPGSYSEKRQSFGLPKPPQIQKAKPKSETGDASQKARIESKTFADIEHIIARQRAVQEEVPAAPMPPAPHSPDVSQPVYAEIDDLLHNHFRSAGNDGHKIVLIGSNRNLIEEFSAYFMQGKPLRESQSNIFQYFAAGERSFSDGSGFATIGVTMEKQFTHLLDKIAGQLAGYILLIDASETNKLNYIAYLHTVLKNKFQCPRGVAIFDSKQNKNFALDTIKDLIGAAPEDLVMKLELGNDIDHLHFVREVLNGS